MKKYIIGIITGLLISGIVAYALSASDINYKDGKKVDEALNDLYGKVNGPQLIDGGIGSSVYLDPTDLSKTCNSSNSVSTTGTKTGCMKWYIYDNDGDKYKLILDHNTTAKIAWNTDGTNGTNVAYENSNLKIEVDNLVSVSKWVVTPRLITVDEVNKITGKTGWTSTSKWYCLESLVQDYSVLPFCNNTGRLGWLYDHTYCKEGSNNWKCPNNDIEAYGYWTSSTDGSAGTGSLVWYIGRQGYLPSVYANNSGLGIRPVIEIEKNIVK